MCRLSKAMESKKPDQVSQAKNTSIAPPIKQTAVDDDQKGVKEMKKNSIKKQDLAIQKENQLPAAELENVLHLSSTASGSDASSVPACRQVAHSQEAAEAAAITTSEGSLTSSPQSTIENGHTSQHLTSIDLGPSLKLHESSRHDQDDHHHPNHHHHHHHHHHDHNQLHAHSDASLNDSHSCNSTTNMFSSMLLGTSPPDDCANVPFLLPKNAWPASSSSCTLEEPTFFSSSIVSESLSPDLSLMSTSMSKATPTMHGTDDSHDRRTLPFLNGGSHMHLMEIAAGFHQAAVAEEHQNEEYMISDSEYGAHYHGSNVHSYSSFLAASPPPCLQSDQKANHHVDFLGAAAAAGDCGHNGGADNQECGDMYHQMHNYNLQQAVGDVEHAAYLQYQSAQNWHMNAMQQEGGGREGAYACYWGPSAHSGMVPVMQGGMAAGQASNYMLNAAMELQQAAEQYCNGGGGAGNRHLTHSQSLPLDLDHFGGSLNIENMHRINNNNMALLHGSGAVGAGANNINMLMRQRSKMMSKVEGTSTAAAAMEQLDAEDHAGAHHPHRAVEVGLHMHTANPAAHAPWRTPHAAMIKAMSRHSNKRRSPEGEEEDTVHESAPPLKRSASWDCIGLMYNGAATDMNVKQANNNNSTVLMSRSLSGPVQAVPATSVQLCSANAGNGVPANFINMQTQSSMMKTPPHTPSSNSNKHDNNLKPRARQGIANDPQSIAARHRRERISERLKILQQLVPNGSKVDLVTMLEKAINYVKFLQLQVKVLATDEYWPTPLNKFPKVAAMAKLAADSKEPANLEKVEKALAETIQANS